MDLKALLNSEQYEGAVTIDGPVLILAGAGSGKTRVLTYRMAHMVTDLGIRPYKILAITFTNKAAREMQERVEGIIGERAKDMWISTFHSTCVRILRREIEKLGYKKNFTIYDSSDQKTLITECMKALQINDKDIDFREIASKISKAKDNLQTPQSYMREHESNFREKKIADVYLMYQKRLKENNAMDFDDLICKTVELLKKDEETLEFYQRKFQYIMVDEYQDTNGAQYELVRLLAAGHKNICVVGDDDQCLIEGTLINGKDAKVNIEDVKVGDKVQVAVGCGESSLVPVSEVSKKEYNGEVIKVTTESGKVITSTPNHITFGRVLVQEESEMKRVNLTIFGGTKNVERNIYSHVVELNVAGVNDEISLYDDAEDFATKLRNVEDAFEIVRKAKLTEVQSYMFMPMGSLREGMSLCTNENSVIVEDKIVSVEREMYDGYVYDLNIDNARNYIANDVVVHNCIYQWRGADIKNILGFEKDYPNAKVIKLEQNYRSKGNILDAANGVIVNNATRKDKVLRTEQEPGGKIKVYRAYADSDEGNFVAKKINEHKNDGYKNKDFAILYRTNAQSRIFEESLRRNEVPYKIVGGTRFYDRKEIKDMLSYLKVLVNPLDDIALRRIINVPKRGIGDATINKVMTFADEYEMSLYDALLQVRTIPTLTSRNCVGIEGFMELVDKFMDLSITVPVSHLIEAILKDTGYIEELEKSKEIEDKSRIENLKELVSDAVDFEKTSEEKTLEAYLEKVSLVQDTDKLEDEEDESGSVVLMTIHSAKGLEFPIVFMVGMENGIFPGMSSFEKDSEMEESRRLCYVGITRAKEQLYMTSAEVRRVFGRTVSYAQSDFLNEVKSNLKEYVSAEDNGSQIRKTVFGGPSTYNNPHSLRGNSSYSRPAATPVTKTVGASVSGDELTVGRKVKHPKFGVGTIVGATPTGGDKKLTIAFDNQGIKILMQSLANLEVL